MALVSLNSPEELREYEGKELVVSNWLDISQDMVDKFADVTGDPQWIHIDNQRATTESPFGGTIAHGFLTASLMVLFMNESVDMPFSKMGVNYGFNRLRFTSPVLVGSKLRARFQVKEISTIQGGIQIVWNVTMECDGEEKPALVAEWVTRRYF